MMTFLNKTLLLFCISTTILAHITTAKELVVISKNPIFILNELNKVECCLDKKIVISIKHKQHIKNAKNIQYTLLKNNIDATIVVNTKQQDNIQTIVMSIGYIFDNCSGQKNAEMCRSYNNLIASLDNKEDILPNNAALIHNAENAINALNSENTDGNSGISQSTGEAF